MTPFLGAAAMGGAWIAFWLLIGWVAGVRIRAPDYPDPEHLAGVEETMRTLGPPRLRAVRVDGDWVALEGSHRLAAAARLGLPVELVELRPADWLVDHDLIFGDPEREVVPLRVEDAAALLAVIGGPVHRLPRWRLRWGQSA